MVLRGEVFKAAYDAGMCPEPTPSATTTISDYRMWPGSGLGALNPVRFERTPHGVYYAIWRDGEGYGFPKTGIRRMGGWLRPIDHAAFEELLERMGVEIVEDSDD